MNCVVWSFKPFSRTDVWFWNAYKTQKHTSPCGRICARFPSFSSDVPMLKSLFVLCVRELLVFYGSWQLGCFLRSFFDSPKSKNVGEKWMHASSASVPLVWAATLSPCPQNYHINASVMLNSQMVSANSQIPTYKTNKNKPANTKIALHYVPKSLRDILRHKCLGTGRKQCYVNGFWICECEVWKVKKAHTKVSQRHTSK